MTTPTASTKRTIAALRHELGRFAASIDTIDHAMRDLLEAADDYKATAPIVDGGRRERPRIAEARSAVTKLRKHLVAAQTVLGELPLGAIDPVVVATKEPIGALRQRLDADISALDTALAELQALPHKQTDHHRAVLARRVAFVLQDILHVTPAATRDRATNITGRRGGAAYARVLRLTLELAGCPSVDIGPVIDRGLALLKDPELPHP